MVRNRAVYEEALRRGATRAWERRWEEAIAAYRQALDEFPDEPDALSGLGLALANAGRPEEALPVLQRAAELARENPVLHEQVAQVLERLGRLGEAAQSYLQAADLYLRQQAANLAMERWKDAVRADPSCIPAHVNLLRVYLGQGKHREAIAEYLALATLYRNQGEREKALELCQYALKLDPHHPEILALMDALRYGIARVPVGTGPLGALAAEDMPLEEPAAGGSPVETARQTALAQLAEVVFEETPPHTGPLILRPLSKRELDALLSRGLAAQKQGEIDEAIACYEEVLRGGVIEPAVNFNLGLLYQQKLQLDRAIAQFQQSVSDPQYRLGSLFALGECYRALGRMDEALTHFLEVLKIVDLSTVRQDQADDLIRLYDELAHTYAARGEREQAVDFINALITFLSEKGWEDKVHQARERLDFLSREGPVLSLAEMLTVPGSEKVLQSIGLAQEYLRRDYPYAALDELFRVVARAPFLLPVHRQVGETLVAMGRTEQAVEKFLAVADTYRIRGNFSQATAMYERALRLAPMNITARLKLIDLLVSLGEIDRALEHYLALGDAYYQMAQLDQAREKYTEALRLAPRGSPERRWEVKFLHRIGDIDMQRVEWRRAIAIYERIRDLAPDDEKARLTLMGLYERLGRPDRALAELDGLLQHYVRTDRAQKGIVILEERVRENPEAIPLRARLAQLYLNVGRKEDALRELDILGDLQLQAGKVQDAISTIQVILRLNPPNAEAYRQLLEQLQAGQIPG
ncbi:MAG: tetratricopeptide repeat protein [Anaerolineae bacterium]|nr:tetratricopeptide repeat protein [Anaerolineae bacterium]MDW8067728.1 tetratricopeptide repeat protein [Anaerolineae bacterium]